MAQSSFGTADDASCWASEAGSRGSSRASELSKDNRSGGGPAAAPHQNQRSSAAPSNHDESTVPPPQPTQPCCCQVDFQQTMTAVPGRGQGRHWSAAGATHALPQCCTKLHPTSVQGRAAYECVTNRPGSPTCVVLSSHCCLLVLLAIQHQVEPVPGQMVLHLVKGSSQDSPGLQQSKQHQGTVDQLVCSSTTCTP